MPLKNVLILSLLFAELRATPFVTCQISGQLANNLNQIATTLAYAWDYNVEPYFPELNKSEYNISHSRDRFFFRLNASSTPRPVQSIYNEYEKTGCGWWNCYPIDYQPDLYLQGDFFCLRHFHRYRERLLDLFAPSPEVLQNIHSKYADLLATPNTVSVHIRTYNQYHHEHVVKFLGIEYYKKAMELFPPDATFIIFSDRINWCKHHFTFNKCIFIEGNDYIEDFFLMSMLQNHIISNSCFSWWAAYLDNNPKKMVIAPESTGRSNDQDIADNIYLPDWILVRPNFEEEYPADIKDYDQFSTSVDTQ